MPKRKMSNEVFKYIEKNPLRHWRKCRGFSLEHTGQLLGISKQLLHAYEIGKTCPPLSKFTKLTELTNITYEDYIKWKVQFPKPNDKAVELASNGTT